MIDDKIESELSKYFEDVARRSPRLTAGPGTTVERQRRRAAPMLAAAAAVLVVLGVSFSATQLAGRGQTSDQTSQDPRYSDGQDGTSTVTTNDPVPTTAALLEGRWEPISLDGRPVTKQSAWDQDPWIAFAAGGTFEAWDGCNRISGEYEASGQGSLRFTSWAGKPRGCANFLHPLDLVRFGLVSGDELAMLNGAETRLATYRRVE